MAGLMVLSCPVCGGPLKPEEPRCAYCGSIIVIQTDHPRIDPDLLNRSVINKHIAEYRAVVRRDPNDETAHYGLGIAYFNLELWDEAADELTQAARLMPENPHIQTQLAVVLADLAYRGRKDAERTALDRIDRALRLNPKHTDALMLKAELAKRRGDWPDAIRAWKAAAEVAPEAARPKLVAGLLQKADTELHRDQWLAAVQTWREAAAVQPQAVRTPIADFLRPHGKLLKRGVPTQRSVPSGRRLLRAVGMAILSLVASFVVLITLSLILPRDVTGDLTGVSAFLFLLGSLTMLISPVVGFIYSWRRNAIPRHGAPFDREAVLSGQGDMRQALEAADGVAWVLKQRAEAATEKERQATQRHNTRHPRSGTLSPTKGKKR